MQKANYKNGRTRPGVTPRLRTDPYATKDGKTRNHDTHVVHKGYTGRNDNI